MIEPPPKQKHAVIVKDLGKEDINLLVQILRQHVRDLFTHDVVEDEVEAIQDYMRGCADNSGRVRHYLVANDENQRAVGCTAISTPDVDMERHFDIDATESLELLNVFVHADYMGGNGIGRAMFTAACEYAKRQGARFLMVNSGPRYISSWGFYDRVCDSSHGFILNKYGPGRHAKTWKKKLQ